MQGMVNNMEEAKLKTLVQIKAFVDGTSEAVFRVPKEGRNQFVERVLKRLACACASVTRRIVLGARSIP